MFERYLPLFIKSSQVILGMSLAFHAIANVPDEHFINHIKEAGEDDYYYELSRHTAPLSIVDKVVGEHQNTYYILGFAGDHFSIKLDSIKNLADFSVDDTGVDINQVSDNYYVTVDDDSVWVKISVTGYPYAEYRLTVTKQ